MLAAPTITEVEGSHGLHDLAATVVTDVILNAAAAVSETGPRRRP